MSDTALRGHLNSGNSPAVEGSPNVFIGGVPVLRVGDHFADDSVVMAGASHVKVNGRPVARRGDPVSGGGSVAEGCPEVRIGDGGGGEGCGNRKHELILCLPEIAAAEAERSDGIDSQGWLYLRDMFIKWLQAPARYYPDMDPEPFWVDWGWVMSFYRASGAYYMLTYPGNYLESSNIYNIAAKKMLASYLERDGKLTAKRETFDYTKGTWRNWLDRHFQYSPVRAGMIDDGLMAALAKFTLRTLASGYVEPGSAGRHTITVTGVSVFVEDRFAFQEEDNFFWWSFEKKMFLGSNHPLEAVKEIPLWGDGIHLRGSDFLHFQERHNRGNDFLVFTAPNTVEDFQEMRYDTP